MRTLRLLLLSLVASTLGLSPVVAQAPGAPADPPKLTDAQKKELEDKLQQLMKQLRELEAKKAEEAKKAAQPENPKPGQPASPPLGGGFQPRLGGAWQGQPGQPVGDRAVVALQGLLKSSDPKVVALAKELLALLPKPAPPVPGGNPYRPVVVPPGSNPGAIPMIELKFERLPADGTKPRIIVKDEVVKSVPMISPWGTSSLKLSADGKTAAVVNADGTITIYDVASGTEQMKFPAKK